MLSRKSMAPASLEYVLIAAALRLIARLLANAELRIDCPAHGLWRTKVAAMIVAAPVEHRRLPGSRWAFDFCGGAWHQRAGHRMAARHHDPDRPLSEYALGAGPRQATHKRPAANNGGVRARHVEGMRSKRRLR